MPTERAHGVVEEIEIAPTGRRLARKVLFRNDNDEVMARRRLHEIEVMQKLTKLRHPHIARFVAAYYESRAVNILMEPVAECDLRVYMDAPSKWPTKVRHVQRWYLSLASALERMHGVSFRHKDIKPANILIKGDSVVLADFGTSLEFAPDSSNSTGHALMTPKYCAPEVARHQTRGRSSDIFSLGCVFLELVTVEIQSSLDNLNNCLRDQGPNNIRAKAYHQRLDLVQTWIQVLNGASRDSYQRTVLSLCSAMLAGKPDLRPTAASIVVDLCKASKYFPGPVDERCPCCCYDPFLTNMKDASSNFGMPSKQPEESVGLRLITLPKSMNGVKLLIPSGNSYSVTPWDSGLLDLRFMEGFEWLWSSAMATSGTIVSADSLAIHKFL